MNERRAAGRAVCVCRFRSVSQQPADADGVPLGLVPGLVVEPLKPGLPVELVVVPVCPVPVVALGSPLLLVPGVVPLAIEPHGRPIASVRPLLFSELAVEGLVPVVPDAEGLVPMVPDADGLVLIVPDGEVVPDGDMVDVPLDPLIPPAPDDAPAPPDAPPPAPPLCASASPALPARRIAAIRDTA
jgi:hypothetical protein